MLLDGGVFITDPVQPTLAGYTPTATTAAMGGRIQAHQRCASAFPGSHHCSDWEFKESHPLIAPPAPGAWVDVSSSTVGSERATSSPCQNWTSTANWGHSIATPAGYVVSNSTTGTTCATALPLACCYRRGPVKLRGYTSQTTNAAMGGRIQAHQRCHAEFPGSRHCTDWEFKEATPTVAPPAPGAWVDVSSSSQGNERATSSPCQSWTSTANWGHSIATPAGYVVSNSTTGTTCATALPLACCQ